MARRRKPPDFVSWSGIAYRATTYDVPLWVSPNRRAGRWNRPNTQPTQYMSLDPEAPYAELLRCEELRTEDEAQTFISAIWQLKVVEGAVVDYSTFEKAEAAGFPPDALIADDRERCQAEAEFLRAQGARGILSPSAALPDSISLTLFGARVEVGWNTAPALASMMPVLKVATGSPPRGLVARVRHYGDSHAAFVEYQAIQRRLFP
jgi:hypothetical protein